MTIVVLRWFRKNRPVKQSEPEHVKRLVRAGLLNVIATTASTGRRLS